MRLLLLLLLPMAFSSLSAAECSTQALAKARSDFQQGYAKGKYQQATAALAAFHQECGYELFPQIKGATEPAIEDVRRYYWLISDLLLGLSRSGQLNECIALAEYEELNWGSHFYRLGGESVLAALQYNAANCKSNREQKLGSFSQQNCPIAGAADALAIPSSWQMGQACLRLFPGQSETDFDAGDQIPPYVELITATERHKLAFADGKLGSGDFCGFSTLALGRDKQLRISGSGGFCWQGSAVFMLDSVYRLQQDKLTITDELFVPVH
ncbi:MAG: hypothetical protein WStaBPW_01410 [Shewanella algae]